MRKITHLSCMLNKSVPPMPNTFFTVRAPLYMVMMAKWPPTSPLGSGHTRMASALITTSDARVWACRSLAVCRHAARTAGSGVRQQANATAAVSAVMAAVRMAVIRGVRRSKRCGSHRRRRRVNSLCFETKMANRIHARWRIY